MKQKKQWKDMTTPQRVAIVVAGTVEVALTTFVLADLARRPNSQVRGVKRMWALLCVVQPVGPLAYLAFGRRR